MKKLITFLSGYARAGKTTAMAIAATLPGVGTVSTSSILHSLTARLLASLFNMEEPMSRAFLADKSLVWSFTLQVDNKTALDTPFVFNGPSNMSTRDLLIAVAEGATVPTFGRQVFPRAALTEALSSDYRHVVFETIGGAEYTLALSVLNEITETWGEGQQPILHKANIVTANDEELSKKDYRKHLSGGLEIRNEYDEDFDGRVKAALLAFEMNAGLEDYFEGGVE